MSTARRQYVLLHEVPRIVLVLTALIRLGVSFAPHGILCALRLNMDRLGMFARRSVRQKVPH